MKSSSDPPHGSSLWQWRAANPSVDFLVILVVGLVVGVTLTRDYGLSWDEYFHEVYARQTIDTYSGTRPPEDTVMDLKYYGPAFNVFWFLSRNAILKLIPELDPADAGHFVYYLAFLAGTLFFYALARRIAGRAAGLAATLVFVTQPAIFGHAFVNPKDVPFTASFLASVWAGFFAVDLFERNDPLLSIGEVFHDRKRQGRDLLERWQATPGPTKVLVAALWLALVLAAVDFFWTHRILNEMLALVGEAHAGKAPGLIQSLFAWVAQDARKTPLEAYIEKGRLLYLWARVPALIGGAFLDVWLSARILHVPRASRGFNPYRPWPAFLFAGVVLGLCSAIRVFGLFAGGLTTFYFFVRLGKRGWWTLAGYWILAAVVLYGTWPYLWRDPVGHLLDAILRMGKFPWTGRVLYEGLVYSVTELPWHYVLRSLLFQLTLPAILMGGAGIWVAVATFRTSPRRVEMMILLVWLGLPLAVVLALGAQIYDAFRQMMFILPPLFLLGALGTQDLFHRLRRGAWRGVFLGIALLPGLVAIVRLHPYEYIYHNMLVGGVSGAFRRYELDGWCISYREAMEFLNTIAPIGSRVGVPSESHTVQPFAREDLVVDPIRSEASWRSGQPGFAIICTRRNADLAILPEADVVWAVEREGALLTVIKRLP